MKFIRLSGSPWEIGEQLGAAGREAWHAIIVHTPLWQAVVAQQDGAKLIALAQRVQYHFPDIWQELQGLASGLAAPFNEVFAWNCRGDLLPSTSDGCTSLASRGTDGTLLLAHNEDGLPELYASSFLVDVTPLSGVGFMSFAYPGSLCGHTFSVNHRGIVNIVNNIRAQDRPDGLPRQVLARAALSAKNLESAIALLSEEPRCGAFHHTLAQAGDPRIISLEATGQQTSILEISDRFGHANHLIHTPLTDSAQKITASSAARQIRIDQQLSAQQPLCAGRLLALLSDQHDEQLPIYRQSADDPDQENTLATVIFTLSPENVSWEVYRMDRVQPENKGILSTGNRYENAVPDQVT
ncbi:C45 family autoproteolytic acyltransferase/hydolase [Rosenbergiella collisarenosi]|uniref:C45 family autoproteolytic acyltransferase/hydolase n=1 Tax=Rosenbergiella collisarenosi TaxID=1544695 RepID=UPI001F501F10